MRELFGKPMENIVVVYPPPMPYVLPPPLYVQDTNYQVLRLVFASIDEPNDN